MSNCPKPNAGRDLARQCEFGLLKREGMVKVRLGNGESSPIAGSIKIPNTPVSDTESGENRWPRVDCSATLQFGFFADRPSNFLSYVTSDPAP
jgi:hypothetical protein